MNKLNKLLLPLYILFLIFSYFYVKSVIKGIPVSVEDKIDEKSVEVKRVDVTLTVKTPTFTKTYKQESKTNKTVSDLLLQVRENNTDFTFDRTAYSYGSQLDHVNNIKATDTMSWKIFDGDNDITSKMDSIELVDGKSYLLVYEKISQ
ncbi:hypothetical protein A2380_00805 [candidate division WWE3 bacterium RIFOXYB1_FULL_43_24]|nr:MAG: hypothetical protein UU97_C0015G0013 [candidate division WWE3 bacterium GW2011_GWD1_42_14]OGC59479.1 MAG: hypothetical protein A2212_01195 [candidate division WWE3 bacterium RIFOXYA1_FULL_42_9]OGC69482.1 MAG: hypothetical protein A2380_00805 [candidate division WWE3 bacterium RIFOXYB1_FULL_43_24]OGC72272.1 MAG: hypothetical protein A2414_03365 [candidate division WWE3 bacterium RIFOXYC1_FULL_42_13]